MNQPKTEKKDISGWTVCGECGHKYMGSCINCEMKRLEEPTKQSKGWEDLGDEFEKVYRNSKSVNEIFQWCINQLEKARSEAIQEERERILFELRYCYDLIENPNADRKLYASNQAIESLKVKKDEKL